MEEQLEEKRWVLTADIRGRIRSVSRPDSELFDFAGADLVGCSLCDTIDIFAEVRGWAPAQVISILLVASLASGRPACRGLLWQAGRRATRFEIGT